MERAIANECQEIRYWINRLYGIMHGLDGKTVRTPRQLEMGETVHNIEKAVIKIENVITDDAGAKKSGQVPMPDEQRAT